MRITIVQSFYSRSSQVQYNVAVTCRTSLRDRNGDCCLQKSINRLRCVITSEYVASHFSCCYSIKKQSVTSIDIHDFQSIGFPTFCCILRIISAISIFKYTNFFILMLDSFYLLSDTVVAHCSVRIS